MQYGTVEEFIQSRGAPLYHATREVFDSFDLDHAGSNTGWPNSRFGIFFLEDRGRAEDFGRDHHEIGDGRPVVIKEMYGRLMAKERGEIE